jgi:hypothetical protein
MSDEPEYLQRLRRAQQERLEKSGKGSPAARPDAGGPAYSAQEQETLRWARELAAGTELRSIRNLAGARFAVLVRLQSASGMRFLSVEGLSSRDALKERVKPGATVGEEVLGAYEVKGGRPVTLTIEAGQVALKMGEPRRGANAVSPEKMLRQAATQAELRAKTRANKSRER